LTIEELFGDAHALVGNNVGDRPQFGDSALPVGDAQPLGEPLGLGVVGQVVGGNR
jgi:hypothetical protein